MKTIPPDEFIFDVNKFFEHKHDFFVRTDSNSREREIENMAKAAAKKKAPVAKAKKPVAKKKAPARRKKAA